MARTFGSSGEITILGVMPQLAPNLTWPADTNGESAITTVTGIDPSAGLTTVLSITSTKGYISYAALGGVLSEAFTIKLTIDGVIIWNDSKTMVSSTSILIGGSSTTNLMYDVVQFDDSFLLEVQSATDTNISFSYLLRKIL